tara:strand:+ start:236 stop:487 length:252 start_codon:yes stop_codon:yes gene_type:complete
MVNQTTEVYHYRPIQEYESTKVERALDILEGVVKRERRRQKRNIMDAQLTTSLIDLLEYELIPELQKEVDYDPTPETAYDFFH